MLSWICRSPMLRLRRVARAVAFRSSAASLCRELRRAFPSTNPISMLEQGERPNAALVGVGLVLGLAMALVVRHQQHGAGRQPRNARLFAAWGAAAVTIAKGRLWLWRYLPFCLRPWAFRLLGTRYSPAIKVNRVFALRHSNYSEKLRWTLELSGEQFQEVPVAVFLARPTALYHSLGASERLPIVSTSEGRGGLQTVPALTEHLSKARWRAWMYPEGAHELENKFEQDFGDAAMGVAYAYLFRKEMHSETMEILSRGLPLWQRMLVPTLAPGVMLTMSDGLRLKEALSANMRIVEKTFGFVESILSDGRCYLCGDSISMADITFASLAFPVILPEETASVFVEYDPRFLPRGYVETIKSLRSREGGMFALRLYRHKRTRKGGAAKASCARSPRRGRSFTVRKNVNSPSRTTARGRGDRRATITQATRTEPLVPPTSPKHRASIAA